MDPRRTATEWEPERPPREAVVPERPEAGVARAPVQAARELVQAALPGALARAPGAVTWGQQARYRAGAEWGTPLPTVR